MCDWEETWGSAQKGPEYAYGRPASQSDKLDPSPTSMVAICLQKYETTFGKNEPFMTKHKRYDLGTGAISFYLTDSNLIARYYEIYVTINEVGFY